jgi:hypothetical protein
LALADALDSTDRLARLTDREQIGVTRLQELDIQEKELAGIKLSGSLVKQVNDWKFVDSKLRHVSAAALRQALVDPLADSSLGALDIDDESDHCMGLKIRPIRVANITQDTLFLHMPPEENEELFPQGMAKEANGPFLGDLQYHSIPVGNTLETFVLPMPVHVDRLPDVGKDEGPLLTLTQQAELLKLARGGKSRHEAESGGAVTAY